MSLIRRAVVSLLLACPLVGLSTPSWSAAYTSIGAPGTLARSTGSISPALPTGWAAGNLCVLLVMSQLTASDVITDPSGWTVLVARGTHSKIYGRIMVGGDTAPSITFSQTNGHIGQIQCYSGDIHTDLNTIVHTSNTAFSAGATVPPVPNITVTQADTLLIIAGSHIKTATSNGATYDNVASFTEIAEDRPSGGTLDFVWNYWQQTTASSLSGVTRTMTGTTESNQVVGLSVSLLTSAAAPTFSVAPAIGTRTTSSIPVTATTACTDCTFYGVAVTDGSGAPTCTQVKAGQDSTGSAAYKAFSTALTASVQGTGTFSTYTNGTVRDGYFCLTSTASGDSAVSAIADMYKTPAFSVAPNIASSSTTSLTVGGTLDGPGTVYALACVAGTTTPTTTDTRNGVCPGTGGAQAFVSESVTGADTQVLGSLTYPIYDVYVASSYGGVNGSRISLQGRYKLAPTDTTYDILASVGSGSFCEPITSPAVAAQDVVEIDSATTSGTYPITTFGTCHLSYTGDDSRQRLCYRIYDYSAGGFMSIDSPAALCSGTRAALWFNNQPPGFAPSSSTLILDTDSAMESIDLCAIATDAEGDTLTGAITVGTPPTGLSVGGTGDCTLSGTPTVESESGVVVTYTVTDIAGATADLVLTIYSLDTLTTPDCGNISLGDCIDALQAVFMEAGAISLESSITIPAGNVINQNPAPATEQEEGTEVDLIVSSGAISKNRRGIGINLGVGIP